MNYKLLRNFRRVSRNFVRNESKTTTRDVTDVSSPIAYKNRIKAWQIHSYGDLNELQLSTARTPIIGSSNELLIQVKAASLNPIDLMMISGYGRQVVGMMRNSDLEFPLTLGRDFSGYILDKGQDVGKEFKIGDPVYGVVPVHKQGALAEIVLTDRSLIRPKPDIICHIGAASLCYAALTAWSALYVTGELCLKKAKDLKILVLGASGGVGTLAVQMLKAEKATVIGTCSEDAIPLVQECGSDQVFDYLNPDFVKNVSDNGPYDIILDCAHFGYDKIPPTWVYNKFISLNSPLVKNTDRYGIMGGILASAGDLFIANITKCIGGKSVRWGFFYPFPAGIKFVDNLIVQEKLYPVIDSVYGFEDVPKAFEHLAGGHLRGKIVVDFQ